MLLWYQCHESADPCTEMFHVLNAVNRYLQAPAKRGTGRGRVGGRPVTEQGVLRNLNKRKSARRGDDYDGATIAPRQQTAMAANARIAVLLHLLELFPLTFLLVPHARVN